VTRARPRTVLARVLATALALGLMAAMGLACASATESYAVEATPARSSFAPVAQAMVHTCGTLDCHGTPERNLRLYGNEGQRLAATDRPLAPACTTGDEIDQDFAGVVGLEPEVLAGVVAEGGADPEALLFVRKGRGTEHHKPGPEMTIGDPLDTCITSWLAGAVDTAACADAGPPTYPVTTPAVCEPGP
jgi:hypothetical protein